MVIRREWNADLALVGRTKKELCVATGMGYDRLVRGFNGFSDFTPEEERIIRKQLSAWKEFQKCPHEG